MIAYLDTSAVVPLIIGERTSDLCRRVWDDADDVVSSVALRPEAASALWRARHAGRITAGEHSLTTSVLADLLEQMHLVTLDDRLAVRASELATLHGLRGYDAVHAATALAVVGEDGLAVSGDRALAAAWRAEGIAVCDLSTPS